MNNYNDFDFNSLTDFDLAYPHIFVKVHGKDMQDDLDERYDLSQIPFTEKDDLIITYHIRLFPYQEQGVEAALITNSILDAYQISKADLHDIAMTNTQRMFPPTFTTLPEVLFNVMQEIRNELSGETFAELVQDTVNYDFEGMPPTYVLSNQNKMLGASTLLYPGVLEEIADQLQSDLIVLPSSVHEVLIIPDDGTLLVSECANMVRQINQTEVSESDRLSNNPYYYSASKQMLMSTDSMPYQLIQAEKSQKKGMHF